MYLLHGSTFDNQWPPEVLVKLTSWPRARIADTVNYLTREKVRGDGDGGQEWEGNVCLCSV